MYAYVNGDPVNYDDPTGEGPFSWLGNIFKQIWPFGGIFGGIRPGSGGPPPPVAIPATASLLAGPTPFKTPTLGNANKSQQDAFPKAANDTAKRLRERADCAKLIGSGAVEKLEKATFRFALVEADTPTGFADERTYASANLTTNTITINAIGHFFQMMIQRKDQETQRIQAILDARVDPRLSIEEDRV